MPDAPARLDVSSANPIGCGSGLRAAGSVEREGYRVGERQTAPGSHSGLEKTWIQRRAHVSIARSLWIDCQLRTVTFEDGSTLLIAEVGSLADFASPGNAGQHGYIGFGLPGNPQFLDITQTIISGTGHSLAQLERQQEW